MKAFLLLFLIAPLATAQVGRPAAPLPAPDDCGMACPLPWVSYGSAAHPDSFFDIDLEPRPRRPPPPPPPEPARRRTDRLRAAPAPSGPFLLRVEVDGQPISGAVVTSRVIDLGGATPVATHGEMRIASRLRHRDRVSATSGADGEVAFPLPTGAPILWDLDVVTGTSRGDRAQVVVHRTASAVRAVALGAPGVCLRPVDPASGAAAQQCLGR